MRTDTAAGLRKASCPEYTPRPPAPAGGDHYVDPRVDALLSRLRASRFADFRGARADVTLPIADRLLNELIGAALPPNPPVRDVRITSRDGNRIGVRFKLTAAAFLPPLNLTLVVDEQPRLPASPTLVLRLEAGGLLSMAGSALRFLDALPPGLSVEGDRIHVHLAILLADRGLGELLEYADEIRVTTVPGAVVVAIRAGVPGD